MKREFNKDILKKKIKKVLPSRIISFFAGLRYGWYGDFSSWNEAAIRSTGYDSQIILEKVKYSLLMVRDGLAPYERDSVIFSEVQYSFPLLSGLMWIAAQNSGKLNVLDYGGSLGSSYFQNKRFLDSLSDVHWCIVEQPNFVQAGLDDFSSDRIHFFYSIDECLKSYKIDVVLFSSVLQYLEDPYELLEEIKSGDFDYVIIDRTPFVKGEDRITIQKVSPIIYKAKYPCWFFNKTKFLNFMNQSYELILEFDALDRELESEASQ